MGIFIVIIQYPKRKKERKMKVTYHATKRFLQRVLKKDRWTMQEFHQVKQQLEEMFMSVVPGSYARFFALPQYKGYVVVHQDNTVITILEKDQQFRKKSRCHKKHCA
jgi:hypothetical protein